MCCSVLQCVAVCCSVLQCVAVCCSVLQCVAVSEGASGIFANVKASEKARVGTGVKEQDREESDGVCLCVSVTARERK